MNTVPAAVVAMSSSPTAQPRRFRCIFVYIAEEGVSAVQGTITARGITDDEAYDQRASSRASDEGDNGGSTRKKLRLSKEQSAFLEESFKEHNTLNPTQKLALAKQLNLRPRQVEVWFQNQRARFSKACSCKAAQSSPSPSRSLVPKRTSKDQVEDID